MSEGATSVRRILVTGGFGFLGSHLIEALLQDPANRVHVVDNLTSNPLPPARILEELGHPEKLTYSVEGVSEYCRSNPTEPLDEIYHLASLVGPAGVLAHSGHIALTIVEDAVLIAQLADTKGARLLFVSSSEVYGGGQSGRCEESMPMMISPFASPRLEYATGKLSAETLLLNLYRMKDLDVRIIRPFNISGPRQSGQGGFVLPRFVGQALMDRELTVFGNGSQFRAFTHVKDIVCGLIAAMASNVCGEVLNLGNSANRINILELAESVIDITGSKSGIAFVDPKQIYGPLYEEANDKFPDATKASARLDWAPVGGVDQTIRDCADYMHSLPESLFAQLAGLEMSSYEKAMGGGPQ